MTSGNADGRERGVLGDWNDERGYGFITPTSGGSRVFVHVSAFPDGRRPASGPEVTYARRRDERGRARASEVRHVGSRRAGRPSANRTGLRLVTALGFFALLIALLIRREVPAWLVGAYGLLSMLAVVVYRADKSAAVRGTWRTSESTLHVVALLGGWPGALVARQAFRHKTTKQPFRTIFSCTVVANCAALTLVIASR